MLVVVVTVRGVAVTVMNVVNVVIVLDGFVPAVGTVGVVGVLVGGVLRVRHACIICMFTHECHGPVGCRPKRIRCDT